MNAEEVNEDNLPLHSVIPCSKSTKFRPSLTWHTRLRRNWLRISAQLILALTTMVLVNEWVIYRKHSLFYMESDALKNELRYGLSFHDLAEKLEYSEDYIIECTVKAIRDDRVAYVAIIPAPSIFAKKMVVSLDKKYNVINFKVYATRTTHQSRLTLTPLRVQPFHDTGQSAPFVTSSVLLRSKQTGIGSPMVGAKGFALIPSGNQRPSLL